MRQALRRFFSFPDIRQEWTARNLLLFAVVCLTCLGTIMIGSASIPYGHYEYQQPLYFLGRHLAYLLVAVAAALIVNRIPLRLWFAQVFAILGLVILLLIAVLLLPGGDVNGAKRWIALAGLTFQPSELAKFAMILFTADFVVRREDEIRYNSWSFFRFLIPLGVILLFLLLEPDLGASVVIAVSCMAILFLAGAPVRQFVALSMMGLGAVGVAIVMEPYRLRRLLSFTNPWDDELGSDFQLKQALIAFGRGEWTGVGLGHSVQKLSYLPEAHTDFILAIVGEELGWLGITTLLLLEALMIGAVLKIGFNALHNGHRRSGFLACGIAMMFLLQTLVNAGMNMGLLPTKGLTLPLISYGGTALVMTLVLIGLVLRIDRECSIPVPRNLRGKVPT